MAITLNGTVGISSPDYETGTLTYSANGLIKLQDSQNTYVQAIIQNSNTGIGASADLVLSNDISTDSVNYANFGINSSTFTGTGSFNRAGATYLLSSNSDMVIGTITANPIRFVSNNTATDQMFIGANGYVGINTVTPSARFQVEDNINGNHVTTLYNSNTGGSTQTIYQLNTGGRFVNQTVNYTSQFYQVVGTSITTSYNDFDNQNLRNNAGTSMLTVNTTVANVQSTNFKVGNALTVNSLGTYVTGSNNLTLGTSSAGTANGYTFLPNGLLLQWGVLVVNSTSTATFPVSFPTACRAVNVTPITSGVYNGANVIYVSAVSTTTATIRSATTSTTATAYYTAIGN